MPERGTSLYEYTKKKQKLVKGTFLNFEIKKTSLFVRCILTKILKTRAGQLNFEIVNFPFLDGDVPRSPSRGVYIYQLIRFATVCSNVDDFNNRNLF